MTPFLVDAQASGAWTDGARRAAAWLESLTPLEVRPQGQPASARIRGVLMQTV